MIKNVKQMVKELNNQLEMAHDQVEQANQAFRDKKDQLNQLEYFNNNILPVSDISIINNGDVSDGCSILTCRYRLHDRVFLFIITEIVSFDYDDLFVGHIIDYEKGDDIFACHFRYKNYEKRKDLFDRLLAYYAEWSFNL